MKKLLYLILCLEFSQFCCFDPDENDYPDPCDKGTFVTDEINAGFLLWSKNGDELFAVGDSGIFCVDMVTASIRVIDPTTDIIIAKLSPDGNRIYYMLAGNIEIDNNTGPLYSISIAISRASSFVTWRYCWIACSICVPTFWGIKRWSDRASLMCEPAV